MRLGCCGCFVLVALAVVLAAAGWGVLTVLDAPGAIPVGGSARDAGSAQHKLYTALQREPGGPVTLTEAEVNALISRHLGGTEAAPVSVRLADRDTVELLVRVPVGRVLHELSVPPHTLPGFVSRKLVWVRLRGRPRLEGGTEARGGPARHVAVDVDSAWIGRLRLPVTVLRLTGALPALRSLRWRAPVALQELRVEEGRVVIHAAARDAS